MISTIAERERLSVSKRREASLFLQLMGAGLLFLTTGFVGVWAAYDQTIAWERFGLLLLAVIFALGIARIGDSQRALAWLGTGCALLAAGLGIYFVLTADWVSSVETDFRLFPFIGIWVQRTISISWTLPPIQSNAAGGALAVLLPLAALGIYASWRERQWMLLIAALFGLGIGLATFLLSSSRGGWIGLWVGIVTALAAWWFFRSAGKGERFAIPGRPFWLIFVGSLPLLVLIFVHPASPLFSFQPLADTFGENLYARGRPGIWRNMLTLLQDYPYTGSGLGNTTMVYSTYVLLLHVKYFSHAHNLFLQIVVEQGIVGLASFAWLLGIGMAVLTRVRRIRGEKMIYLLAVLASFVALLVHGVTDSEFYASRLLPLILLPVGMALAVDRMLLKIDQTPEVISNRRIGAPVLLFMLPSLLFGLSLLLPNPVAAFHANVGAIRQADAELSVYEWPAWPMQDALRRSHKIDLAPAQEEYARALAMDGSNVTANRRLGQIALSQGEYEDACRFLERAHTGAPTQLTIKQLLGECYAIGGRVEEAADLWREIRFDPDRLRMREWWYSSIDEKEQARYILAAADRVAQK
ncbi:MAG: O-antigen ligase family protein [Caldilineaceae bacterium]|nr:O-antigen ligase family protein [Caldilineaceae bacterium]